ncbi:MAG: hypothetical protein WC635_11715 [Bacteriovorax sp.]|jgi:cation:H+ antiporter
MFLVLLKFIIAALFIVLAGTFLTKFSDKIAEHTGWGRMFVGGILLAGATSLPELMVDVKSIQLNLPDLAAGDLLGSSLFNLLILATLDFAFPSDFRRTAFSPIFLHHSLAAVLSILLTAIVGIGIISNFSYSILGASIFCWAVLGAYLFGLRLIYLESNSSDHSIDKPTINRRPLIKAISGYTASAVVILLSAPHLVHAADELSKVSGIGHTFIGTVLIALTTSLPELVATFTAFKVGKPDLALGNIFGSNAFNMILFLPLDFFYPQILFSSIRSVHAVSAFAIVAVTSVAVMGQLYRKKERSRFSEPSSEVVLILIIILLFLLYKLM